jgi:hypothetical protein
MPAKKAEKTPTRSHSGRGSSKVTTNHNTIRRWTEKRGGHPATVKGTAARREHAGLLRIDFPDYSGQCTLKEISWDDFFGKFDEEHLAFLYQEKTAGGKESRFCKLIDRETAGSRRRERTAQSDGKAGNGREHSASSRSRSSRTRGTSKK